jgi:hypothetical protein
MNETEVDNRIAIAEVPFLTRRTLIETSDVYRVSGIVLLALTFMVGSKGVWLN